MAYPRSAIIASTVVAALLCGTAIPVQGGLTANLDNKGFQEAFIGLAGTSGSADGPALEQSSPVRLNGPKGMCHDGLDSVYILEETGNKIRKIDLKSTFGDVVTFAGTGVAGISLGTAVSTAQWQGQYCTVQNYEGGHVLYTNTGTGNRIVAINVSDTDATTSGSGSTAEPTIELYAGASSSNGYTCMPGAFDVAHIGPGMLQWSHVHNRLYFLNHQCGTLGVRYANGTVTSIVGGGSGDGTGTAAALSSPSGMSFNAEETILYVASSTGIRQIVMDTLAVTTLVASTYAPGTQIQGGWNPYWTSCSDMILIDDHLFLLESSSNVLLAIDTNTKYASIPIGGTPELLNGGNTLGDATVAQLNGPGGFLKPVRGVDLPANVDNALPISQSLGHTVTKISIQEFTKTVMPPTTTEAGQTGQQGTGQETEQEQGGTGQETTEYVETPVPSTTTAGPTAAPCSVTSSKTGPYYAISGQAITVPVTASSCTGTQTLSLSDPALSAAVIRDGYEWSSTGTSYSSIGYDWNYRSRVFDTRNYQAGTIAFSADGTVDLTVTPYCRGNDTTLTLTVGSTSTTVTIHCLLAYPEQVPSVVRATKIHTWFSTSSVDVLSRTLLAVYQNWPTSNDVYVASGVLSDSSFTRYDTFSKFQDAANGVIGTVTDSCAAFAQNSFTFADSNGIIVLAGNFYGASCTTSDSLIHASNTLADWNRVTDVIITDHTVASSVLTNFETQTYTLGYPDTASRAVRKTLERYAVARMERVNTGCGSAITGSIPAQGAFVQARYLEERTVRWQGVCGVTQCCIDGECSAQIGADGQSCVLPRFTKYGIKVGVTLKTATGAEHYLQIYFEIKWTSEYWMHRYGQNKLVDTADATEFTLMRNTLQRDYCLSLVCIKDLAALKTGPLPLYSRAEVCTTPSSWDVPWWYRRYQQQESSYSYSWVYYYYSVYGWARNANGWTGEKTETIVTLQRPATESACGCKVLGVRVRESITTTVPAQTRIPTAATGTTAPALDTTIAPAASFATADIKLAQIPVLSPSATAAQRKEYCTCWAKDDAADERVAIRANVANKCFRCPAIVTPNTLVPRGFWRIWAWGTEWYNRRNGENGNSDQVCFMARAPWNSDANFQRRCCYDRIFPRLNIFKFIDAYPSTMKVSVGWGRWPDVYSERFFATAADLTPEQVCCRDNQGLGSQDSTCRLYRDRRPVGRPTLIPFIRPRGCDETWTPAPRMGWGRGDPYCNTLDGAGFECNFWGEALWTGCGGWSVHTAAEPVSNGAGATIITGVAVKEGNETVVVQRGTGTRDSVVRVNGDEIDEEGYEGLYLSVNIDFTADNLTIARITSLTGGHITEVHTANSSLSLAVAPNSTCAGTCTGLMGNCDGDHSNDIKSRDGSVQLSNTTASARDIFFNVVQTYLINDTAQSLFDYTVSTPDSTTTFTPTFITASTLTNCPASCNADPGCCLDSEVAGPAFAGETAQTLTTIQENQEQGLSVGGSSSYNWPPTISMSPIVNVLEGLAVSQDIVVVDSNGIQTATIDACTTTGITCTQDLTVDATTTRKWTLTMTADQNITVTVTATDSKGASTTGYMTITSLPPAPQPANSVSYTLFIPGTGFNAANVYEARVYLGNDLAAMVNNYWDNKTGAPGFTAAADFEIASISNAADGTGVSVTVYVSGETAAEAQLRLDALNAQTSLTLTELISAIGNLLVNSPADAGVQTGEISVTTAVPPTPMPTEALGAAEDSNSGAGLMATTVAIVAALAAVLF